MDGERLAPAEGLLQDRTRHERGEAGRLTARRPKTIRWLIIVGLLLAVALGGLYGFNRFREQAIATYFASNRPPPAHVSAAEVKTEAVPRFAPGIGSVTAIHQVTINPEIGGRVTKIFFEPGATVKIGDPLVQLNDAPERGDLANYEAQVRWAETTLQRSSQLAQRQFEARETVDQKQSQLDQARAQIIKTEALIAQRLIRAPFSGQLGTRQIEVGQYVTPGARIVTLTDLSKLYVNFTLPSQMRPQISVGNAGSWRQSARDPERARSMGHTYRPFAALAGAAIGGLTSFATSWTTQQAQARAQRLAAEREARTAMFGRFLDEAAKLYSDALQNSRDDITAMIGIYALMNRIRLTSSPQVVEAADTVCRNIVDTYLAPNVTLEEMRANWVDKHVDPLRDFSEACRQELQTFGRY